MSPRWLPRETVTELAACARLRNVLVHQYEELQLEQVYRVVSGSLPLWRAYLEAFRAL